mgnify:CR=1 FL=1
MKDINTFLYISLVRYKALNLILKKFEKHKITLILDLEDSVQDLFSKKNNFLLKKLARNGLLYLSEKKILRNIPVFIRINSQNSIFYSQDLNIVKKAIKKGLNIKGIFLPKVDKYNQVTRLYNKLNYKKKTFSIVPIIETKEGLKNLKNILFEDQKKNIIHYIHYGHYDFCLDNNFWPFPEPYHLEFWEIVRSINKIIIEFKKKYIHTPFPLTENDNIYWSSVNYMRKNLKISEINLSLVNINMKYIKKRKNLKKVNQKKISTDVHYKRMFAEKIVNEYFANKSNNKSFSLSKKRFIPPHLYLAAKKFIKSKVK